MSEQLPPSNPYQPAPGPGPGPSWAPDHPDAAMALVLGIIGMTACQLVAPFAWVKGARVKREIEASQGRYGGGSQATIGFVLGIVGTGLLALYLVGFVFYLGFVVLAVSSGA